MDDSPDDLTVKELLETYFRVEDLQKVLKAFDLPFAGRKSELFERVLSLINHRQYELEFIHRVKRKITQTYRQRVRPEVNRDMPPINSRPDSQTSKRSVVKHKSKVMKRRYEEDYSYEESSDDNSSEASSSSSSDSSFKLDDNRNKSLVKKKQRCIITSSSDESDQNNDKESDQDFESNSVKSKSKRQNNVIEKNVNNKTKKSSEKKTKSKIRNKKQKSKRIISESSSSDCSVESEQNIDSSDSDIVQRVKNTVKKNFLNVNLSSDSEETNNNQLNNNINNTNDEESDDEIEFLGEFKSNPSTNRTIGSKSKTCSGSQSLFKDSSSSDTESSVDMDCDPQNQISNLFPEFDGTDPSLVIDNSSSNKPCDSNSDKTTEVNRRIPEVNAIPLITENVSIQSPIATFIKSEYPNNTLEQMPSNNSLSPKFVILRTPKSKVSKQNIPKLPNKSLDELPEYIRLPIIDPNSTLSIIKRRINFDSVESSEIEAIDQSYKLSLICPITNKRVLIPARSNQCQHVECFDINAFMEMNSYKKLDEWRCPKCKQPAKLKTEENNIIIDGLVKHILSTTEPSCEAVIFNSSAIWSPDIKKLDNFSSKANPNDIILLDHTLEDIIELDDDEDINPVPETQNTKSIASEIESAKSFADSVSNLIQSNSNKEKSDTCPTNVQQDQQELNSIIDQSSIQIEQIARFLSTVEQEISRPAQNSTVNAQLQTQQQRQQTQISIPSAQQHSRPHFQEHRPIAQQSQQDRHQISTNQLNRLQIPNQGMGSLPNNSISSTNLNEQSLPNSRLPNQSNQQTLINRSAQQTYVANSPNQNQMTNNSSSSMQSSNLSSSSDHITFDFDSSGNICSTCTCQICNEQIVVGHNSIEIHVNGERHKRLKQNYHRIQSSSTSATNNSTGSGSPLTTTSIQPQTNRFVSFRPQTTQIQMNPQQMQSSYSHYGQHSTNNTFQTQYPMQSHYVAQQQFPQSHQNYFQQQYPQYYPERSTYQSSIPRPTHRTQGVPPPAHITTQSSTQFSSTPNYRSIAHHNQSYPYNYL